MKAILIAFPMDYTLVLDGGNSLCSVDLALLLPRGKKAVVSLDGRRTSVARKKLEYTLIDVDLLNKWIVNCSKILVRLAYFAFIENVF